MSAARATPRPGPPGPDPLTSAFAVRPAPVPWRRVWGTALTTSLCYLLGLLTGHVQWGAWAFFGGFASFYVAGQPYRRRAPVLAAAVLGLAAAMVLGGVARVWWLTGPILGAVSAASTYLAGRWRIPLPSGLMFILVACLSAAQPHAHLAARVLFVLIGGAIAWLVGMSGWPLRPHAPEVAAVHDAYRTVAACFGPGSDGGDPHHGVGAVAAALAATAVGTRRNAAHTDHLRALARGAWDVLLAAVAACAETGAPLPDVVRRSIAALGAPAATAAAVATVAATNGATTTRAIAPAISAATAPGAAAATKSTPPVVTDAATTTAAGHGAPAAAVVAARAIAPAASTPATDAAIATATRAFAPATSTGTARGAPAAAVAARAIAPAASTGTVTATTTPTAAPAGTSVASPPAPEPPPSPSAVPSAADPDPLACTPGGARLMATIARVAGIRRSPSAPPGQEPVRAIPAGALHPSPLLPFCALRIGTAVALSVAVAHLLGMSHLYWVPLTCAAVLQGETVLMLTRRAIQRVAGTVAGLLLAGALLAGLHLAAVPALGLVVVLQALMLLVIARNYAIAVVFVTAFAFLILSVISPAPAMPLVLARLGDTLLGVGVALAATYLLWPRASSRRLPAVLQALVASDRDVLTDLLAGAGAGPRQPAACTGGRHTRLLRALLLARAVAEDARAEVPPAKAAAALLPLVRAAERLGYLLLAVRAAGTRPQADAGAARQAQAILDAAARRAVSGRPPEPPADLPVPDLWPPLARELQTLARG